MQRPGSKMSLEQNIHALGAKNPGGEMSIIHTTTTITTTTTTTHTQHALMWVVGIDSQLLLL